MRDGRTEMILVNVRWWDGYLEAFEYTMSVIKGEDGISGFGGCE